jgi:hypothetical protein
MIIDKAELSHPCMGAIKMGHVYYSCKSTLTNNPSYVSNAHPESECMYIWEIVLPHAQI